MKKQQLLGVDDGEPRTNTFYGEVPTSPLNPRPPLLWLRGTLSRLVPSVSCQRRTGLTAFLPLGGPVTSAIGVNRSFLTAQLRAMTKRAAHVIYGSVRIGVSNGKRNFLGKCAALYRMVHTKAVQAQCGVVYPCGRSL